MRDPAGFWYSWRIRRYMAICYLAKKTGPRAPSLGETIFMKKFCCFLLLAAAPVFAQAVSATINGTPSREYGQPSLLPSLNSIAPNLVEGRELNSPAMIAFDTSASPPILYISDTLNNRIVGYQNPAALSKCGTGNPKCGFANIVVGQNSLTGTLPGGPNEPGLSFGFYEPSGIAVDASGNLYVADTQNNRIVRFPSPVKQMQNSSQVTPDLVIGQSSFGGNQSNQGQNIPSNQTLALSSSSFRPTGMVFDGSGNLWVTDGGNNRVVRYPATQLVAGSQPAADTVIGQTNFSSNSVGSAPSGDPPQLVATSVSAPTALAFDSNGNLYVADSFQRILYYPAPLLTGMAATRILGLVVGNTLPNVNQYALGPVFGLATLNNHLYVTDVSNNRIVEYDVPANWPAAVSYPPQTGQQISPPMIAVIGQANNMNVGSPNNAQAHPGAGTLQEPFGLAFNGTDLWVADTFNNRVIDFPQQSGSYTTASRVVGQLDFIYGAANLIEGREVYFSGPVSAGGIAVDHSSNPPHLYIADTYNNRILCFKDARSVSSTSTADLVLGQSSPTDFYDNLINNGANPSNPTGTPTQTGLYEPIAVLVDTNGDLFVTDSGNGRVLRYPSPYAQPANSQQLPNLVLGQSSFYGPTITDPTPQNMHSPWGIGLTSNRSLVVSDVFDNRILVFSRPSGGDFQNGQAASAVLGQTSFTSGAKSNSTAGLASPTHLTVDSSDRVYVCDTGNNRVVFFNSISTSGATSAFQLNGLNGPEGIVVTQDTGEIWIANTGSDQIYRFPVLDDVELSATPNNFQNVITAIIQTQTGALGLALDDNDNLLVAESANRITFFFSKLTFASEASYNNLQVAPGELLGISQVGKNFSFTQNYNLNGTSPWPTLDPVNNVQVIVSAPGMTPTLAPIFRVDPTFISFQVPTSTPPSGTAVFQVINPTTGQIMGEGDFQMAQFAPGFFTSNASGSGQVAAFMGGPGIDGCTTPNCNINTASNPVPADGQHYISFCLTGGGVFQGGPADGVAPAPGQTAATALFPTMVSANGFGTTGLVPAQDIGYSGAGCGFAGGWQVNFTVPTSMGPNSNNVILLELGSTPSNVGPNGQQIQVWFATK